MAVSDKPIRRPLLPDDAALAVPLSAEAGWNQTEADWRMLLEIGEGMGLWTAEGRLAATALILPYGESFAWISMVLVTADFRRRGLASELLRACVATLRSRGLPAVLDATEAGRKVYLPLGFRDVFPFHRLRAPSGPGRQRTPVMAAAIRPMAGGDLAAVAAFDAPVFGADRSAILTHLCARCPERALVAEVNGALAGYVLARDGRDAHQLGPLVAGDGETAIALAGRALAGLAGPVYVDVPDHQTALREWLAGRGFAARRGFTRMIWQRDTAFGDPARVYAVAGPELG